MFFLSIADLLLKNGLVYQKVQLKNHPQPILQFVLPESFVCKVILACHDDSGHFGMERTLGLLKDILLAQNSR